jgi:hypothetical protein
MELPKSGPADPMDCQSVQKPTKLGLLNQAVSIRLFANRIPCKWSACGSVGWIRENPGLEEPRR